MAVSLTVNAEDVTAAANYLEQYLTDAIPLGDFRQGTALRDLTAQALAAVFALLRAEAVQIRELGSLRTVQAATTGDAEAQQDAVSAILSNIFIAPKDGAKGRGQAVGHVSQLVDIFIPTSTLFTRTSGVTFIVASDSTYIIPKAQLIPIIDANSVVLEYTFTFPLIAVTAGDLGNIRPGMFESYDRFNPYIAYIENPNWFAGGYEQEGVDAIIERAPTALSVRNLINDRSITAVLNDTYGEELSSVFVVGMGMPEMQRDQVPGIAEHLKFHVGGATDIYLWLDLLETTYTGDVGSLFARPDGVITVFRDNAATDFSSVIAGDILRVQAGFPIVPAEFLIVANNGDELIVSALSPFPLATEEQLVIEYLDYTIGRVGPEYKDIISGVGGVALTTGISSRQVQTAGAITLPGGPVMEILDVAILDPDGADVAYQSPLDGFIHFPAHVNSLTGNTGAWFYTVVHNPLYAQSAQQWMELYVGLDDKVISYLDGKQLRVKYSTLNGFASIDTYIRSRRERTCAASQLPRGHFPVSVQMDISYKLKTTATAELDDAAMARRVAAYINGFDTAASPIDTSAVESFIRNAYPSIGAITPLTITYTLFMPTGALRVYESTDELRIDSTKQISGDTDSPAPYSVTDRTLRYLANSTDIRPTRVY
jgi:hypothetical protein